MKIRLDEAKEATGMALIFVTVLLIPILAVLWKTGVI